MSDDIEFTINHKRDTKIWESPVHIYKSVEEIKQKEISYGLISIYHNNLIVDVLLSEQSKNTLMVSYHGARTKKDRPKLSFPIFAGKRLAAHSDLDFLIFSDSTLQPHDNLRLAWHLGDSETNLQEIQLDIIKKIIAQRKYEKVIFVGGSGAGLPVLIHSAMIPGSYALVVNPQTDVSMYHKSMVTDFICGRGSVPLVW